MFHFTLPKSHAPVKINLRRAREERTLDGADRGLGRRSETSGKQSGTRRPIAMGRDQPFSLRAPPYQGHSTLGSAAVLEEREPGLNRVPVGTSSRRGISGVSGPAVRLRKRVCCSLSVALVGMKLRAHPPGAGGEMESGETRNWGGENSERRLAANPEGADEDSPHNSVRLRVAPASTCVSHAGSLR